MRKILAMVFCLFTLGTLGLYAQQGKAIEIHSVMDAIEKVLVANPSILIYELQKEKAEKNYKIAKAHRLPTITGSAVGQRNINLATTPLPGEIFGQPGEVVNAQLGQEYNYNAGFYISKNLFDWQLQMNTKLMQSNIDIAKLDLSSFKQKLKEETALYYFSALIARKALEINKQDLKIADSIMVLTQQKFSAGLLDKINVNQAAMNYYLIKQTIGSSEQMLNTYLNELHILLGRQVNETTKLTETIEFAPSPVTTVSLKESMSVKMAWLHKEHSLLQIKTQKGSYYPKLTANSYLGQQQYRDNFGLTFSGGDWTDYRYLNLNISIPIFTGFTNKNKVKISKLDAEIALHNYEIEKEKGLLNDRVLLKNYETSLEGLQSSFEHYQLNRENTALTLQQYNEGLIGLDMYFKSFEDYLKSQNNYLNTLSSTYIYYASILSRQ
ncbi:MAG: TolC family protein [Sediminicola sp.]|tara:strand:+ start:56717 stop:58033 length:1317 start_codon:yes stop_codon:yes gene_type:complete